MSLGKEPLVSITISCYNHKAFIADCILSIIDQSYFNIELIVCDDCSTDSSWQQIEALREKMEKRFQRVVLYRNPTNMGITKTVNRLLHSAKGDIIKTMAGDDMLVQTAIEDYVDYMSKKLETDIVISNGVYISENIHYPLTIQDNFRMVYYEAPNFNLPASELFEKLYQKNYIFAPGNIVRRRVFEINGYYDETLEAEDWDYWLRIIKNGKSHFAYFDKCLVAYRISGNSFCSKQLNEQYERRRIRDFNFTMKILEKYKDDVAVETYANKKIQFIIAENKRAVKYRLKDLMAVTKHEYANFKNWKDTCLRVKLYFLRELILGKIKL